MGENDFLEIYFDNSATTKPCQAAVEAAVRMMTQEYANPSSLHRGGFEAQQILEGSRGVIASPLGCEPKCIYFTPSGTVANNTAIFSAVRAKRHSGSKIVTTAMEHPSVSRCMDFLEASGFEVVRLKPDRNGNVSLEEFSRAIDPTTVLVSVMAVNNEVGSVLPFDGVKDVIKRNGSQAFLHVDAVQAYMKTELAPEKQGIDLLSISAHKVHAIKGAGALYVARDVRIKPYILGGGQENGLVSGTQAMPAIAAFSAAADELSKMTDRIEKVKKINSYFKETIKGFDFVSLNSPDNACPFIVNISVKNIPSQVSVNFFSEKGVYVSAGSACSKGHRSEVLTSMGLDSKRIDSAVRISFGVYNTEEEIDYFAECLEELGKLL